MNFDRRTNATINSWKLIWNLPFQKMFWQLQIRSRRLNKLLKILEGQLGEDRTFMSWSADRTHSELNKNFLKTYNRSSTKCKYLGSSKGGQKPDNVISPRGGSSVSTWTVSPPNWKSSQRPRAKWGKLVRTSGHPILVSDAHPLSRQLQLWPTTITMITCWGLGLEEHLDDL
jgi:hypothetical protein